MIVGKVWRIGVVSTVTFMFTGLSMASADEILQSKIVGSAKADSSFRGEARLSISASAKKKLLKDMKKHPKKYKKFVASKKTRPHNGKINQQGKHSGKAS